MINRLTHTNKLRCRVESQPERIDRSAFARPDYSESACVSDAGTTDNSRSASEYDFVKSGTGIAECVIDRSACSTARRHIEVAKITVLKDGCPRYGIRRIIDKQLSSGNGP